MPSGKISGMPLLVLFLLITWACGGTGSQGYEEPDYVEPFHPSPTATSFPEPPSNLDLPPLPDFKGTILTFGMGGGPLCDDYYKGPPSVHGAANSFVPARTGYVCIFGVGYDSDFRVELTAPDNSITLGGNYFVSGSDFGVYWRDFNLSNFGSYTNWLNWLGGQPPGDFFVMGEAYTRSFIKIRWRGDLPTGTWHIRVLANDSELTGEFTVLAPEYPSITVVDSRQDWIIPSYYACHLADQPQDLFALAEGYPSNQDVYLYVYEQNEGLVYQSVVRTDSYGSFYTSISGPYHQDGRYFLVGSLEPQQSRDIPYGNTMDCFFVP